LRQKPKTLAYDRAVHLKAPTWPSHSTAFPQKNSNSRLCVSVSRRNFFAFWLYFRFTTSRAARRTYPPLFHARHPTWIDVAPTFVSRLTKHTQQDGRRRIRAARQLRHRAVLAREETQDLHHRRWRVHRVAPRQAVEGRRTPRRGVRLEKERTHAGTYFVTKTCSETLLFGSRRP